jgi:hypothetical protein
MATASRLTRRERHAAIRKKRQRSETLRSALKPLLGPSVPDLFWKADNLCFHIIVGRLNRLDAFPNGFGDGFERCYKSGLFDTHLGEVARALVEWQDSLSQGDLQRSRCHLHIGKAFTLNPGVALPGLKLYGPRNRANKCFQEFVITPA